MPLRIQSNLAARLSAGMSEADVYLPVSNPCASGEKHDLPDAVMLAERNDFLLDVTFEHVVDRLVDDDAVQQVAVGDAQASAICEAVPFADADIQHLALRTRSSIARSVSSSGVSGS